MAVSARAIGASLVALAAWTTSSPQAAVAGPAAWTVVRAAPPVVATLEDVDCPGGATCFAVGMTAGGASVVRRSSDAGSSWATVATMPAYAAVSAIACGSASRCVAYAVGSPTVVVTTDGWARFAVHHVVGQRTVQDVACGHGGWCDATASDQNAVPWFLTSSNGGASWLARGITGDVEASTTRGGPASLACWSRTSCVVTGVASTAESTVPDVLFRTANAGLGWQRGALPARWTRVEAVACPSAASCALTGVAAGSGALARSTTAGASWRQVLAVPRVELAAVSCPTSSSCVAIGTPTRRALLAVSTGDGGRHWTSQSVPGTVEHAAPHVSCAAVRRCVLVAALPGGSLEVSSAATGTFRASGAVPQPPQLRGLSCPSTGTCLAAGALADAVGGTASRAYAERTTDGGATWVSLHLPAGVTTITAVSCATAASCALAGRAAAGAAQLLTTADGGATWATSILPKALSPVDALACPTTAECVAAGAGRVGVTQDDGSTWSLPALPASVSTLPGLQLTGVACPTSSRCDVVGRGLGARTTAVFLASGDAGATWSAQLLGATGIDGQADLPTSVACASSTSCVAAGIQDSYAGASSIGAFASRNGTTWTVQPVVGAEVDGLAGPACGTAGVCLLIGAAATLGAAYELRTTDGVDWSATSMPAAWSSSTLLACPPSGACVSIGSLKDGGEGVVVGGP